MLPPLERLPEARPLVERGHYFIVHAPRQTGKTTLMRTLAETLTAAGTHAALLVSCEAGSAAGEDYGAAQRSILAWIRRPAFPRGG
jgi:predicted AAA+ superfamily ATPase